MVVMRHIGMTRLRSASGSSTHVSGASGLHISTDLWSQHQMMIDHDIHSRPARAMLLGDVIMTNTQIRSFKSPTLLVAASLLCCAGFGTAAHASYPAEPSG